MPWWESGLFWGIAGIVAGFLISTAYYYIGKERILMKHRISVNQIIPQKTADMPGIRIFYNNLPIEELTETTIKFTNSGNRTIDPSDYATKEPLGVHISGHLYKHNEFAENKNSIPEIDSINDNKYTINFDFLKQKQSFSIILLHDGIVDVFGELRSGRSIGIVGGIITSIINKSCACTMTYSSLFFLLISQIIYLLFVAIFIIKPLLFTVFGVIVGILTGEILFAGKDFLMNFYNKFNHKGGGG